MLASANTFCVSYLTPCVRKFVRAAHGGDYRLTCYQQWGRWREARVFEALTNDLRQVLRLHEARPAEPSAIIFDSRTLQSTP